MPRRFEEVNVVNVKKVYAQPSATIASVDLRVDGGAGTASNCGAHVAANSPPPQAPNNTTLFTKHNLSRQHV